MDFDFPRIQSLRVIRFSLIVRARNFAMMKVHLICFLISLICGVTGFCSHGIIMENRSLLDMDFSRLKCVGLYDCAARCLSHDMCQSFTFDKEDKICALSSGNSSFNLVTAKGHYFSDIQSWEPKLAGSCSERPCPWVQQCSVSRNRSILCDQPPLGTRCSTDFQCVQFDRSECHNGYCVCAVGFYLKGGESKCRSVINSVCHDDDDCGLIPSAVCNGGKCTCNIGDSFDLNQTRCRSNKECSEFTSTFTSFMDKAILGFDAEMIPGISMEECQNKCDTNTSYTCKAVEFTSVGPTCFLNEVSWHEVPSSSHMDAKDIVYMNRDCKWGK